MRLDRRVAELEKLCVTSNMQFVVCIPIQNRQSFQGTEIAPGIFISRYGYPDTKNARCIAYSDREKLAVWLALPEQIDTLHCVYKVLTADECDVIRQRLERSC